jgi:hypothetical protein
MVHEVFATYFFQWGAPYIIETGHGALASLAYLPSILVGGVFHGSDLFNQMLAFSYLFYALSGAAFVAMFAILIRSKVAVHDLMALLMVSAAPALLERETNFGLMINYDRAQALILVAVGGLVLVKRGENFKSSIGAAILVGLLAGYACSVKFSNLVTIVPFMACLLIEERMDARRLAKHVGMAVVSAALMFAVVMVVYSKFSLSTLVEMPLSMKRLYSGPWLDQRTPFLSSELKRFDGGSYYLSLQIVFASLLILYPATARVAIKSRSAQTIALVAAIPISLTALALILSRRLAQGTMIDVSLVTLFSVFLCVSLLLNSWTERAAVVAVGAGISGVVLIAVASMNPAAALGALAHNSSEARRLNQLLDEDNSRPIVYYTPGMSQPALIPSPEQICGYKITDPVLIAKRCPRFRIIDPRSGLTNAAHYAVLPQYLDTLPETPQLQKEWPEHWQKIQYLDTEAWQSALRGRVCHRFNFVETQSRAHLVYFSVYAATVTVCVI